jgi:hypothetical protein
MGTGSRRCSRRRVARATTSTGAAGSAGSAGISAGTSAEVSFQSDIFSIRDSASAKACSALEPTPSDAGKTRTTGFDSCFTAVGSRESMAASTSAKSAKSSARRKGVAEGSAGGRDAAGAADSAAGAVFSPRFDATHGVRRVVVGRRDALASGFSSL